MARMRSVVVVAPAAPADLISSAAMRGMEVPTRAAWIPFAPPLTSRGWLLSASSAAPGRPAAAAAGRTPSEYWQSARIGRRAGLPQVLTVRLPSAEIVSGLSYAPWRNRGVIGRFRVSLSLDGRHFGRPIATGRWQANGSLKQVEWFPAWTRSVRLTMLSTSTPRDRYLTARRIVLLGAPTAVDMHARTASGDGAYSPYDYPYYLGSDPSVSGQWGPTIGFPLVPVAAAPISGNRLLVWSAESDMNFNSQSTAGATESAILDLTSGTVTAARISNTAHDMFCPGLSILFDGELLVAGGISINQTSLYDPATNTWRAGSRMNIGRAYQGQATLSDGQAFAIGGSWLGARGGKLGEIWSPTGGWRELPGVPADAILTADAKGVYRADNHVWLFASSGGRVFQAGPSKTMHWITTSGAGSITSAGARGSSGDEMNGNAVLFDVNKILAIGGAPSYDNSNATTAANVVDLSSGTARVTATSHLTWPRAFTNSVVLPTGAVLAVGGQSYAVPFSDQYPILFPELWDPATGRWTVMAPQAEPRVYHSVAVLLPDGRVFSGGGGLCGSCATNHPDGAIFSPPYLFNPDGSPRPRPAIASAPSTAALGQTITATTDKPVASFVLMRFGSATHSLDTDQRRIPLSIVSSQTSPDGSTADGAYSYQVAVPSDPGVALPGPYMLFAIDSSGTPSVAKVLSVVTPPAPPRPQPYVQSAVAASPAVYWPLSDPPGTAKVLDLSANRDCGLTGSGITYGAPSPVEGTSGHGATFDGGQLIATQAQAAPARYAEAVWFKTTSTTGGALVTFGNSPSGANTVQDRMVWMSSTGRLAFGVFVGSTSSGTQNTIESPRSYNDGNWHFLVATQGASTIRLYVDGRQVASRSSSTGEWYIARWQLGGSVPTSWPDSTGSAFVGTMSDAALYGAELSASQIQSLYASSPASSRMTS